MTGLLRAEFLKLRTARTTWWTIAALLALTAASWAVNMVNISGQIAQIRLTPTPDIREMTLENLYALANGGMDDTLAASAANLYTSGQYIGLLVGMLFGVYLIGGEFGRRTIATTLLIEPRRHRVLAAKLIVAIVGGLTLWALTAVVSLPAGVAFLHSQNVADYLNNSLVLRSLMLNTVAFLAWSVLGLGLGCLMRRLTASVVVALLLYLTSFTATQTLFAGGAKSLEESGIDLSLLVPSVASRWLVDAFDSGPDISPWLAAGVLMSYGLLSGLVGLWLLRHRDIA